MLWPIKAPIASGNGSGTPGGGDDGSVAQGVISALRDGAPEDMDTFKEVSDRIREVEKDPGDLTQIVRNQMG